MLPCLVAIAISLGLLAGAGPAVAADPHDDLCSALKGRSADSRRAARALAAGADPDLPCQLTVTEFRLRFEGLMLLLATGGAAAVVPGWLGPRAWEQVDEVVAVPPLALASQRRSRGAVEALLDGGASPMGFEGEYATAVAQGELSWAEFLAQHAHDRRVAQLPASLLRPEYVARLVDTEPQLHGVEIDWYDATSRFARHPEMLATLQDAGLPREALTGAFEYAVVQDELTWAGVLAERGALRSLTTFPDSLLEDRDRMDAVVDLKPRLRYVYLRPEEIEAAAASNPRFVEQLDAMGVDLVQPARLLLADGEYEAVAALVEAGLDVDRSPEMDYERGLLADAVGRGDDLDVAFLLGLGATPGADGGEHPVLIATVGAGDVDIATVLIEEAVPPTERADWWLVVAEQALERNDVQGLGAALRPERGGGRHDLTALVTTAVTRRRDDALAVLVEADRDPTRAVQVGLARACELGHPELVPALVALGARPSDPVEPSALPPLHWTLSSWSYHQANTVAALLAAGADVRGRDAQGRTALDVALQEEAWDSVPVLADASVPMERAQVELLLGGRGHGKRIIAVIALAAHAERIERRPGWWARRARRAEKDRWPPDVVQALEEAASRLRERRRSPR